jgi:hypothetical protein
MRRVCGGVESPVVEVKNFLTRGEGLLVDVVHAGV